MLTTDPQAVPSGRINCSPLGFFRATPPAASWAAVVLSASTKEQRVYYRVRQCLGNGAACVVSTSAETPAYVELLAGPPPPPACQCRVPSAPASSPFGSLALSAGGLLLLARRGTRRRS